ncbi:hypothetical protein M422DRAFT_174507 [Sphaerobolus stellatus SS14]|uniref:MI domain-containing protein n=1 Tax=Sphaerobolus stellatus (strain SS14) TaxID=990650 RepID=A0A0C9VP48_SPHS4|nr:hypothetical protein M422DRAFT_174507 [Sphaerobolus stellatus SS14]
MLPQQVYCPVIYLDFLLNSVLGTKYVPPHLRKAQTEESERLLNLTRQMKGLLNRMSEQNMDSILQTAEELYRNQRRNDVTTTLTKLIIDGISLHSSLLDTFVVLHAALVASLHKIVGVDFTGHFIQTLVESYEKHYEAVNGRDAPEITAESAETKGKECLNLIVLLSELYNFQVLSCVLVYDIIRGLLEKLNEFDVELLLKIARNSGPQLRQDDPSALKDIVDIVHQKVAQTDNGALSSRTKFMIDTLTLLKNNKVKRSANPDGHTESVERMKKFLSGVSKKYHVLSHEPLRVTLQDLHSADKRGKWWIVGAAWAGDPLVEHARAQEEKSQPKVQTTTPGDALMKLARKQGMNTDVRRSIFVILMSSDDYVDACERLGQLNLNETQQREIIRVILHCLGNEKQYNPYYTLTVQHLCQISHSHKITLQYCLWDFLREMGEKDVGGAEIIKISHEDSYVAFDEKKISSSRRLNIARAYGWWLAKGSVTVAILKPVDFTMLQPHTREFLQNLFYQLFISSQVASPAVAVNAAAAKYLKDSRSQEALEAVFMKATRIPTLTHGILYLFKGVVRGENVSDNEVVSGTIRWAREVAQETLRAGLDLGGSID